MGCLSFTQRAGQQVASFVESSELENLSVRAFVDILICAPNGLPVSKVRNYIIELAPELGLSSGSTVAKELHCFRSTSLKR